VNDLANIEPVNTLQAILRDERIMRMICDREDESLNDEDVANLLRISTDTLKRMISRGEWQMVKGPNGKYQMTRKQFREQQDLLLQFKKRRR
jgi:hypothetical protein